MAGSGFCLEGVKKFMIDNDCKVTNHELVTHFKSYLNDPDDKSLKLNREKFKEFVNTLAGIKTDERGEKILVLKKKFRPDSVKAASTKQDVVPSVSSDAFTGDSGGQEPEGVTKTQSAGSISSNTDQPLETSSTHLSTTSSISSVASTNSGPGTSEDDVNASIVSVKERALHLNRMESESELQKIVEDQRVKGQRSTRERDGEPDDDSHSSGSCFVSLDAEEKEWVVLSSTSEYHPMHKMLTKNPNLVKVKDFTSGYTALHWAAKHNKPDVIKLLASLKGADVNKRTNGGYTALHLAAMHGHEEIIELLVSTYKADANLRDYSGKKAKQYLRNTASTKAQRKHLASLSSSYSDAIDSGSFTACPEVQKAALRNSLNLNVAGKDRTALRNSLQIVHLTMNESGEGASFT